MRCSVRWFIVLTLGLLLVGASASGLALAAHGSAGGSHRSVLPVTIGGAKGHQPPPPRPTQPGQPPASGLPALPAGLPQQFWFGVASQPGGERWLTESGAAWDARYQSLAAGVNTGKGWQTWQEPPSATVPPGTFATRYAQASADVNALPVFTYYSCSSRTRTRATARPSRP